MNIRDHFSIPVCVSLFHIMQILGKYVLSMGDLYDT